MKRGMIQMTMMILLGSFVIKELSFYALMIFKIAAHMAVIYMTHRDKHFLVTKYFPLLVMFLWFLLSVQIMVSVKVNTATFPLV